ncbi:MAG TPA: hypothetical protein VF221_04250 [Chloroflexota bacterium]
MSTNSRLLQSLGIAQLVSKPGSRRDYLQISGDSCTSLLTLGVQRMRSMRDAIREMRQAAGGSLAAMHGRLHHMEQCYDKAIGNFETVLASWQKD